MAGKSTRTPREDTQLAVMANDLGYVRKAVDDVKDQLTGNYVTNDQFTPVRNLVYGLVSLILVAVIGALMGLVIVK